MSDDDRTEREDRPKVRVTDRRRVHAEEGPGGPARPTAPSEPPAEIVEDEVAKARGEAEEYREHLQRLKAEFDNYRKRVLKEQTRAIDLAAEPFVRRMLEVLDEFELALLAAEDKPDFERFLRGVELVYAKLVESLKAEGLERIEAGGRPFDPEEHEALMQSGEGEGEPVVVDVLRPGYKLKGRVIRPAGVRVSRE